MLQLVAITSGLVLGGLTAFVWHAVTSRQDTQPLFNALGRSVRAMVSDDGDFLREYGALLLCAGTFVLWNVLALVGAMGPIVVLWPMLKGSHVLLLIVYSGVSMAGIFWLKVRAKQIKRSEPRGGLSVSDSQFFFINVVENAPWLMRQGAAWESRLLRKRLDRIELDRPVFITGLARSGTTMLLELLARADGVATHRYRDFPFLMAPCFWDRYVRLFSGQGDRVERPHQDGILITPESPEAFEEPIWQAFFPKAHGLVPNHVLCADDENREFDEFFLEHLKKMLLIRRGTRYVSKGNYNLTRIEYLASLFPDARFVIPIRHPTTHVISLVRQHELFCKYSVSDSRVPRYLAAAGHFEFGPQRVPVSVYGSGPQTLAAWQTGEEHRGYAIQWAAVYGYVSDLLKRRPTLAQRVMVTRYEDICSDPGSEIRRILEHAGLVNEGSALLDDLGHIKRSVRQGNAQDPTSAAVWDATESVAAEYRYTREGI